VRKGGTPLANEVGEKDAVERKIMKRGSGDRGKLFKQAIWGTTVRKGRGKGITL